jgi:hypothetical protein
MSSLETYLRDLAMKGPVRLHLWPVHGGGFQANVGEPGVNAWTVVTLYDPVDASREALRQRSCGIAGRQVVARDGYVDAPPPEIQTEFEDAITISVNIAEPGVNLDTAFAVARSPLAALLG